MPNQNLFAALRAAFPSDLDSIAVETVEADGSSLHYSWRDLDRATAMMANLLVSLKLPAGSRIAVQVEKSVEAMVLYLATLRAGYVFLPLNTAYTAPEVEYFIRDAEPSLMICEPAKASAMSGMAKTVLSLDDSGGGSLADALYLQPTAFADTRTGWDDGVALLYTSGTTGNPKGVILSHGNICSNINAIHAIFPFETSDRSLSFLPWAHSFGQTCELNAMLSMGCSLGINDVVENLVGNLSEVQPTILFAVPRIFNRIYDGVNKQMTEKPGFIQSLFRNAVKNRTKRGRGEDVGVWAGMGISVADSIIFSKIRQKFGGRLKYAVSGSAALSKEVAEFIDALGIEVSEGSGLTETSPIATANFPGNRKIGSVGKPIPHVTITIDNAVTGDAKHGEILIKGPNIMQGYHNRPEENSAVMMEDRTFRSGDMGFVDEDGYLYITGRIKEQYKLENGKYVVPSPLEEELKLSPFIANVMIHGANKPFNVALVVPDPASLEKWATETGKSLGDVTKSDDVKQLIQEELKKYGKSFKGFERPEKFVLTSEDFTTDNGMLTPTLKLKRTNLMGHFEQAIEGMYQKPGGR